MVINVVDGSELGKIGRLPRKRKRRKEVKEEIESVQDLISYLKKKGEDPIIVYGMSNAIGYVADRIIDRARSHRMIRLLRFYGHGAPGIMSIAGSDGPDMSRHLADLGSRRKRMARRILSDLKPYFSPQGRVEFHGCHVGKGRVGGRFLQAMANIFGVPVLAGIQCQFSWEEDDIFPFEGPVRTAYPRGRMTKMCQVAIP